MNVPSHHRRYSLPDTCTRYATIKEKPASRDTPVCVGHDSEWEVYTSVSNSVDLHLISAESISNLGAFLIYYEGACVHAVWHCGSRADVTPHQLSGFLPLQACRVHRVDGVKVVLIGTCFSGGLPRHPAAKERASQAHRSATRHHVQHQQRQVEHDVCRPQVGGRPRRLSRE